MKDMKKETRSSDSRALLGGFIVSRRLLFYGHPDANVTPTAAAQTAKSPELRVSSCFHQLRCLSAVYRTEPKPTGASVDATLTRIRGSLFKMAALSVTRF